MKYIFIVMLFFLNAAFAEISCPSGERLVAECALPSKKLEKKALICYRTTQPISLTYYFKRGQNVELEVKFNELNKLKRWLDKGTYTRYFGFSRGSYAYVIGVPEEKPGAVAFIDIKKDKSLLSSTDCLTNSFGDKDVEHPYIAIIQDEIVRANNFEFP